MVYSFAVDRNKKYSDHLFQWVVDESDGFSFCAGRGRSEFIRCDTNHVAGWPVTTWVMSQSIGNTL
jgi:hypothetical protein